jgi:hypothetical protein
MTDDDLMRLARKHEGTDPSDDIPQVFALTPLELSALAKEIRREAMEEAAKVCDDTAKDYDEWFAMDHSGGAERCAADIRALSQKDPQ